MGGVRTSPLWLLTCVQQPPKLWRGRGPGALQALATGGGTGKQKSRGIEITVRAEGKGVWRSRNWSNPDPTPAQWAVVNRWRRLGGRQGKVVLWCFEAAPASSRRLS